MSSDPLVVLVRPWRDARGGAGGCCAAPVPRFRLCDDEPLPRADDDVSLLLGRTYELLRDALPTADVQIVDASNSVYLVPTTFSRVRRRSGTRPALAAAFRATTPGAVLVDGEYVGGLEELGPRGVLEVVRDRIDAAAQTRAHPRA